ncbi:MAG TPA: YtxH domain-containing protein [Bacteroidota bacterium]|nr:YtxH domain-containing protein [Bacteroidota bacterium]
MAEEQNGMTKGLLIGFLAGGVVGVLAALLYAPKSGKELRADIKRKASDIAESATDYIQGARTKGSDMINEGKERSDQLIADAKEKAEHILGNAEKVLSGIRQRAGEEPGKVKSAFRAGMDAYRSEKDRPKS